MVLVTALGYASKLNCGLPPKKGKCLYTGNINLLFFFVPMLSQRGLGTDARGYAT